MHVVAKSNAVLSPPVNNIICIYFHLFQFSLYSLIAFSLKALTCLSSTVFSYNKKLDLTQMLTHVRNKKLNWVNRKYSLKSFTSLPYKKKNPWRIINVAMKLTFTILFAALLSVANVPSKNIFTQEKIDVVIDRYENRKVRMIFGVTIPKVWAAKLSPLTNSFRGELIAKMIKPINYVNHVWIW